MSFSQDVKKELCTAPIDKDCDVISEIYGILLFANMFRSDGIRVITGNRDIAARIARLFKAGFGMELEPRKNTEEGRYVFEITEYDKIRTVFNAFGIEPKTAWVRLNRAVIEEDCCLNAFLRGAFLSGGTVSDPETRYHMELVTPHYGFSNAVVSLLLDCDFEPKVTRRQSRYIIYFKSSEAIEDFLIKTGAPISSMKVMQTKVVKNVRNKINRSVNCEMANIAKTAEAAAMQLRAIRRLEENGILSLQPKGIQDAARARLDDPEASLSVLAQKLDPPVSRATMNYRFRRIIELAEDRPTDKGGKEST